ncbi:FG-GAP repeat protein,virulence plasmid B protein, partial [Herbaspirillum sp. CF444]|uniref:FG-GAP-like repeat-containing protein n=1 Tax=Herbaspirillum sp. CF444 TaxID=1144319 RepID=UPI0002724005
MTALNIKNNKQLLSCLLLVISFVPFAQAQMVTPGQFQVSESGAATYTIPIQVSPGVGGMEPKLSLNYSSQAGNGLLGVGWSLGGLGGVGRCPRTMAQDGVRGGVNYDGNDRYCLDGQRLIAVSGSEGGDGTEYRTERESFAKIVSYGIAGNGPAWFKVWTKAGQVMEYGRTSDARIEAQGKTAVSAWALNRIEDTKGNYLTASYTKDVANGSYYPIRVDYAGNSKTNTVPTNSVQFQYEARPDVSSLYHAGSINKTTTRLVAAKSYSGSTLLKEYKLLYEPNQTQLPSRVSSIQECAGNGNCISSLDLQFLNQIGDYFSTDFTSTQNVLSSVWHFGSPGAYELIVGDFNGDGKTDFALAGDDQDTNIYVFLSKGDGTFTASTQLLKAGWHFGARISSAYQTVIGDFNGDGKTDFAFVGDDESHYIYVFLSNGDGTFSPSRQQTANGWHFGVPGTYELIVGDFNGDGKTDFALAGDDKDTSVYVFISQGDGTFIMSSQLLKAGWHFGSPIHLAYQTVVGDFNGDGKTDFAFVGDDESHYIYVFMGNGDGTFSPSRQQTANGWHFGVAGTYELISGDFNGDGKTDFLMAGDDQDTSIYVFLSQGDGTFAMSTQLLKAGWHFGSPIHARYQTISGDFNGDGKTDFAFAGDTGDTNVYLFHSRGDGTFSSSIRQPVHVGWHFGLPPQASYSTVTGDFNGDGKTDFAFIDGALALSYSFLNKTGSVDVSQFKNNLKQSTAVNYKTLVDSGVYVKDSGGTASQYPIQDIQAPLSVVSSVASSNG